MNPLNGRWCIFAFLCIGCYYPASRAERPTPVDATGQQLARLRADIMYLAGEDLRGRSVADETIQLAAQFVADRMASIGLQTDSINGTPFQQVPISLGAEAGSAENNRVVFRLPKNEAGHAEAVVAKLNDGMNPMSIGSTHGQITGPIAFVGYGITAPKLVYDDFAGINVRGATVIMIRKEPQADDPKSVFDGTQNTRHAFFQTKIKNAIDHGASAVIIVNDPASIDQNSRDQQNRIAAEIARKLSIEEQIESLPAEATNNRETLDGKIAGIDKMVASMTDELDQIRRGLLEIGDAGDRPSGDDEDATIPVLSVGRDVVDRLLTLSIGKTLKQIETTIDQTLRPQSEMLSGVVATLAIELKPTSRESPNVIGVLPGRGPLAAQTVIVGAHYDHVGMGGVGSLAPGTVAVHNGADDNASGTSTMLAVAAQMVSRLGDVDSHRRIVFIGFTGEERGLLGSQYYVRHPRFSLETTVAMVNLDMVGRLRDNELTVYGTGSGDLMDQIVEGANRETQFNLFKVPTGYGPSDHQSFYEVGIPVLFFFTGLHNDYHRPSDDFDKIDFGGMTRITDITSNSTFELAIRRERPQYAVTEKSVEIRRQMTAFLGVTLSDRGDQVAITGLTPGGPAEKGGIRVGDRLTTIAGKPIRKSTDVLQQLRDRSPGDEVKIEIIRDGRLVLLETRLTARP